MLRVNLDQLYMASDSCRRYGQRLSGAEDEVKAVSLKLTELSGMEEACAALKGSMESISLLSGRLRALSAAAERAAGLYAATEGRIEGALETDGAPTARIFTGAKTWFDQILANPQPDEIHAVSADFTQTRGTDRQMHEKEESTWRIL